MRRGLSVTLVLVAVLALSGVLEVAAKDPIFVRWMVEGDPRDEAILDYWERSVRDELDAKELVDLGTMLFRRGYPKDAVEYFESALKKDPEMAEAWYRIGLVEHKQGNHRQARHAYTKALDRSSGHGWCNFYMGLLQEQTGNPKKALEHFREAFYRAPELADPKVNPEVLYSKLYLAALVRNREDARFEASLPMSYLEPQEVRRVMAPHQKRLEPTPAPQVEAAGETNQGAEDVTTSQGANDRTSGSAGAAAGSSSGGSSGSATRSPRVRSAPRATPVPAAKSGSGSRSPYGIPQRGGSGAPSTGVSGVSPEASLWHSWKPVRTARLHGMLSAFGS